MTATGIVARRKDDNRVYDRPIYLERRGITHKTVALADFLREALAPLLGSER